MVDRRKRKPFILQGSWQQLLEVSTQLSAGPFWLSCF